MAAMSRNEQRPQQSTRHAAATAARPTLNGWARQSPASGGLRNISVRVLRSGTTVTADVSGSAPMIFDLDLGRINETATAPIERVTQP